MNKSNLGDQSISNYPLLLRWLHAGIALGAVFQLVTSLVLLPPDEKGSSFSYTVLETHEIAGLVIMIIVGAHFIWSIFVSTKETPGLKVLLSLSHWKNALSLMFYSPAELIGRASAPPVGNSLALIVEMLGLLVMVIMSASGTAIWFMLPDKMPVVLAGNTEILINIHSWASNFLWAYVIGHVFMVWIHIRAGDSSIQLILPTYKGESHD